MTAIEFFIILSVVYVAPNLTPGLRVVLGGVCLIIAISALVFGVAK